MTRTEARRARTDDTEGMCRLTGGGGQLWEVGAGDGLDGGNLEYGPRLGEAAVDEIRHESR